MLIKVDCAALPASLIESELFGYEQGVFTGASGRKIGRFMVANGGTIFLDEIGELPLEVQSKLLRVLQEGVFWRLSFETETKVNARVIAATNCDLRKMVREQKFRADLYFRLAVFPIEVPPLRERRKIFRTWSGILSPRGKWGWAGTCKKYRWLPWSG